MRSPQSKILTLAQAVQWRKRLRTNAADLVVTNGCFDLLTPGHIAHLVAARAQGDALLVLLNADASVRALKGPTRPIIGQDDRAYCLAALASVDAVVVFETERCAAELEQLAPDVYVKGSDYGLDTLYATERAALAISGTRIVFLPRDPRYSTTSLLARGAAPGTPVGGTRPPEPPDVLGAAHDGEISSTIDATAAQCGASPSCAAPKISEGSGESTTPRRGVGQSPASCGQVEVPKTDPNWGIV